MAAPKPSAGKPQDPRDENQLDPGPLISPPPIPQVGAISKKKFAHGKFGGRTIRAGK